MIPNIKETWFKWACGPLETVFPPVTPLAWFGVTTELDPGKNGISDYINRKADESIDVIPASSAYYEKRAIWNY